MTNLAAVVLGVYTGGATLVYGPASNVYSPEPFICATQAIIKPPAVLIVATQKTEIVTNEFAPTQYKSIVYGNYPMESWSDSPGWSLPNQATRPNPDVKVVEVREIKSLNFTYEGKEYRIELSNEVRSSHRKRRVVKTDETWVTE